MALQRVQGSNYFELNEFGVLELPGLANIPLLGLTANAIAQRLGAVPMFDIFDVSVSILEELSYGANALEP